MSQTLLTHVLTRDTPVNIIFLRHTFAQICFFSRKMLKNSSIDVSMSEKTHMVIIIWRANFGTF